MVDVLLNKDGWGLSKMLVCSAILLIALFFIVFICFQFPIKAKKVNRVTPVKVTPVFVEEQVRTAAREYVKNFYGNNIKNSLVIPISNLVYYHYLEKEYLALNKTDLCDGYALVKHGSKNSLETEAYIKCNNYETRDYKDWTLGENS